jgi:hypothetical protein
LPIGLAFSDDEDENEDEGSGYGPSQFYEEEKKRTEGCDSDREQIRLLWNAANNIIPDDEVAGEIS